MSLQAVLSLVLYIVIVAVVGFVCIWASDQFAPAGLKVILRAAIVVICILLVLMRLAGYV